MDHADYTDTVVGRSPRQTPILPTKLAKETKGFVDFVGIASPIPVYSPARCDPARLGDGSGW